MVLNSASWSICHHRIDIKMSIAVVIVYLETKFRSIILEKEKNRSLSVFAVSCCKLLHEKL